MKLGCTKDLCCHSICFLVDIVTKLAKRDVLSEWRYADNLVLMSETNERFQNKLGKLKQTLSAINYKLNL